MTANSQVRLFIDNTNLKLNLNDTRYFSNR